MLDAILLMAAMSGIAFLLLWMQPELLRQVAARLWARAHAVETMREAYRKMLAEVLK